MMVLAWIIFSAHALTFLGCAFVIWRHILDPSEKPTKDNTKD